MFKKTLFIFVFVFYLPFAFGQNFCTQIFPPQNVKFNPALLTVRGAFQFNKHRFNGAFTDIIHQPEVRKILEEGQKKYSVEILGHVEIHPNLGGGKLNLVNLNMSSRFVAYNHTELAAILDLNPALANRIGFFKVPGYENLVWIPDVIQMNYRLNRIAQENVREDALWSYTGVAGIIDFKTFIEFLAQGKFPFSSDENPNLSIHDAVHAFAFATLNSTLHSRAIMEIAKKRSQSVLNIYLKLKEQLPELVSEFEKESKMLADGPLERTMLLSMLLSGNYDYNSSFLARNRGELYELQNKEITQERIKNLLRLYSQGAINFKSVYLKISQGLSDSKKTILKNIFQSEIEKTVLPTPNQIELASLDIVHLFFPERLFSSSEDVKAQQALKGTGASSQKLYQYSLKEENID